MDGKKSLTPRVEIIVTLALLSLIFLVRVYCLEADPPTELSDSTDVFTDPAQYTLFAKMYVEQGEFNPFHDYRLMVFLKSSVTPLAVIVFKLLGAGLWQSNFVGLLYSLGALFLFFLFIRRVAGPIAALLYLILICFNYNQLFYGRLPFLEHAMAFYAFLALVLVSCSRRWTGYLSAGLSLGIAIFFGKMIGIVFFFPFGCYFVYRFVIEKDPRKVISPALFVVGIVAVGVFWYFFTYAPMKAQLTGYFGEQAFSLYGAPDGLKSLDNFIWKMVSFGDKPLLFARMPLAGVLGAVFVGMILYHAGRRKSWREGFGIFNAGHVFTAAMIVAFYGSLMIWNYRPLRYELILIYPICGAAAMVLSMMWPGQRAPKSERTPYLFYILSFPVVLVSLYKIYSAFMDHLSHEFFYDPNKYLFAGVAVVVTVLIGLGITVFKKKQSHFLRRSWIIVLTVVLVALAVFRSAGYYYYWWQRPTFTTRDNARDLGVILSPSAVLSGPFAPVLALESNLNTVIHMFGVSEADPDLFKKFPITHLLLDQANESRAKKDYSEVIDSTDHMLTYHVGLKKVRLFRVAGQTGNPDADRYQLSHFEKVVYLYSKNAVSDANKQALEFIREHPGNLSCYQLVGEAADKHGQVPVAQRMFKKAVEFSPTNYDLNARLAKFYKDRFEKTGERRLRKEGLRYFEQAMQYAPTVGRIRQSYLELKETDSWPLKKDTSLSTPIETDPSTPLGTGSSSQP